MPDQSFTTYTFKSDASQSAQVARTLPDRLVDVLNIKDWGAKGDGVTDDTDAINAAIDKAYAPLDPKSPRGRIIFFPPGIYIIGKGGTVQLTLDRDPATKGRNRAALCFVGSGRDVSILRGNYWTGNQMYSSPLNLGHGGPNGFLVIANYWESQAIHLRDLAIENLSTLPTSGALMSQSGPCQAINCRFKGVIGYSSQILVFGGALRDCVFECSRSITAADNASRSPNYDPNNFTTSVVNGSVGCFFGQGFMHNCQATGFDIGFCLSPLANQTVGCKASKCGIGFFLGYQGGNTQGLGNVGGAGDPNAQPYPPSFAGLTGGVISACWTDRCTWGIYLGCSDCLVGGNVITGNTGPTDPSAIDDITWSGGIATVTTHVNHNLPGPTGTVANLVLVTDPVGWTPDNTGNQIVRCKNAKPNQFTYSLAAPASPNSFTSGTWNYSIEHNIFTSVSRNTMVAANALAAVAAIASFCLDEQSVAATGHNIAVAMRGPCGWTTPQTPSKNVGGWKFEQCGNSTTNFPRGVTFNELPPIPTIYIPERYYLPWPVEGDEFDVTDCAGQPNFAGTVTGGGSNHYKVRYDGRKWIRVG
jgi:hypothetical protein